METPKIKFSTVDEYISTFDGHTLALLEEMRHILKQAAPQAKEVISYNMPAIKQHGVLVYYAANKEHIGFYPTASPIVAFKNELKPYKTSKGAIQFPTDQPIPADLVRDIVLFRINEDEERVKRMKKK